MEGLVKLDIDCMSYTSEYPENAKLRTNGT